MELIQAQGGWNTLRNLKKIWTRLWMTFHSSTSCVHSKNMLVLHLWSKKQSVKNPEVSLTTFSFSVEALCFRHPSFRILVCKHGSFCYSDRLCHRYTESIPHKQFFGDVQREQYAENDNVHIHERADSSDCSNFVDLDWLSSSGNSCEEDSYERSVFANSLIAGLSSDNVMNGVMGETPSSSQYGSGMKGKDLLEAEPSYARASTSVLEEFSDSFVQWVTYGETLCHWTMCGIKIIRWPSSSNTGVLLVTEFMLVFDWTWWKYGNWARRNLRNEQLRSPTR